MHGRLLHAGRSVYTVSYLRRQRDARQKRKMSVLTETLDVGKSRSPTLYRRCRCYAAAPQPRLVCLSPSVNCDPCDSTEHLRHPTTSAELQALALASLPPLPEFRADEASYQDGLIPEQPLDLGQAFIASQMSDIGIMTAGMQDTAGNELANSMIEGWVTARCAVSTYISLSYFYMYLFSFSPQIQHYV